MGARIEPRSEALSCEVRFSHEKYEEHNKLGLGVFFAFPVLFVAISDCWVSSRSGLLLI
jgi:hypothetical protein